MDILVSHSIWFVLFFTLLFRYLQVCWMRQQTTKEAMGLLAVPFVGDAMAFIKYFRGNILPFIKFIIFGESEWYGPPIGVFVKDPNDLAVALGSNKTLAKDETLYKVIKPFMGQGLVTSDVPTWKRDRKLIAPSFNQKNIAGYYEIFRENACLLVKELAERDGKDLFNVYSYITSVNLRTICETSLGITKDSSASEHHARLVHIVESALEIITERLLKVWNFLDITYSVLPIRRRTEKALHDFTGVMKTIIVAAEEQFSKSAENLEEIKSNRSKYLLEDLLELNRTGKVFTDYQIQSHIHTVVLAGYETTANTIAFVLIVLGIYPEIQQRVYDDIINVVGKDKPIEYDDLKGLEYLEQVIKETLRIFPVAPVLARRTLEDLQLTNKTVPAGSTMILGILALHNDPEIWPNPTRFDPDRFLPDEIAKRHPYSWIPFSAGPRNCIGIRYAWLTMKVTLAAIIREYSITTKYKDVTEIPMVPCILTKPTEGQLIRIKRRT